jgi:hypothetical protein
MCLEILWGLHLRKWKIVIVCIAHFADLSQHLSQLKMCDFSGEAFKGFEVSQFPYECNNNTTASQRRVLQTAL